MLEDGGVLENMNEEDTLDIEVFSSEEDTTSSIEDFKDSAVSVELNGVLDDAEEDSVENGDIPVYTSADLSSDISEAENVRIIYVSKSDIQNNSTSVSNNEVVILSPEQFEILVDEISSCRSEQIVQTVSMNDYTSQLENISDSVQGGLLINIVMFSLCFGYFVKETVFRGL